MAYTATKMVVKGKGMCTIKYVTFGVSDAFRFVRAEDVLSHTET